MRAVGPRRRRATVALCIEGEAPIELRDTSIRPPSAGEGRVGRIRRTRTVAVEGPARPLQDLLRSCLRYAVTPQS